MTTWDIEVGPGIKVVIGCMFVIGAGIAAQAGWLFIAMALGVIATVVFFVALLNYMIQA